MVQLRINPSTAAGLERQGAVQRLTAVLDLVALVMRATWVLIRWGR